MICTTVPHGRAFLPDPQTGSQRRAPPPDGCCLPRRIVVCCSGCRTAGAHGSGAGCVRRSASHLPRWPITRTRCPGCAVSEPGVVARRVLRRRGHGAGAIAEGSVEPVRTGGAHRAAHRRRTAIAPPIASVRAWTLKGPAHLPDQSVVRIACSLAVRQGGWLAVAGAPSLAADPGRVSADELAGVAYARISPSFPVYSPTITEIPAYVVTGAAPFLPDHEVTVRTSRTPTMTSATT